jgi:translation initiation factor 2 subunit 3
VISLSDKQPEVNIGTIGHIDHGKTTLVAALTGKWADTHSEELKRGISIKLGYANMTIYKCPKCKGDEIYSQNPKCEKHGEKCEVVRKISFVDAPGHETLMATMLSGAAIMDGCLLIIAANEPCPQPQTKEHLMAVETSGIKNIIIVQNKIDLVDENRANQNYKEIKSFVKGTVAENAPIIPVSAQHKANIDVLLAAIEEYIPTPKRDLDKEPIMLVARSFDINLPGQEIMEMKGGVLGGVIKQGSLKAGDDIVVLPGIRMDEKNQTTWKPLRTKIDSINTGKSKVNEAYPGGSIGIATLFDPYLCKADRLSGSVVGHEGKMPPVWDDLDLEIHLLQRVVGTKKELKTDDMKMNEMLMLSAWTSKTVGVVRSITGNSMKIKLNIPVCISKGEKIALSRRVENRWRLVGYGIVK